MTAPAPAAERRWRALLWVFAAAWGGVLQVLSSVPGSAPGMRSVPGNGPDKVFHATFYGVFGALLCLALRATRWRPLQAAVVAVVATVLWGVLDEYRQQFTPGRTSSGFDVLADFTGALVAATVITLRARAAGGAGLDASEGAAGISGRVGDPPSRAPA